MKRILKHLIKKIIKKRDSKINDGKVLSFINNGMEPWSIGYHEYKTQQIIENTNDKAIINNFKTNSIEKKYGFRLDERIVEYPWILSQLNDEKKLFLDAGSTFNFDYLLANPIIAEKNVSIFTYYPETPFYNELRISYNYGDLRDLPYKDNLFEEVVCQSTLEHIDMDNSLYGYDIKFNKNTDQKSYEYLKVIDELLRVLKNNGVLLLTFPFGKFENHGFFQQFDEEMLDKILKNMDIFGYYNLTFFKYMPDGWIFSSLEDCKDSYSYNPHTLIGKSNDFAAHSRAICCIKFYKNK